MTSDEWLRHMCWPASPDTFLLIVPMLCCLKLNTFSHTMWCGYTVFLHFRSRTCRRHISNISNVSERALSIVTMLTLKYSRASFKCIDSRKTLVYSLLAMKYQTIVILTAGVINTIIHSFNVFLKPILTIPSAIGIVLGCCDCSSSPQWLWKDLFPMHYKGWGLK